MHDNKNRDTELPVDMSGNSGNFILSCSPWLGVISLQSCHIGEEDEGGEQEGEEPSFEVRQTEMVWGDQGKGHRGVSGEATPHAVTTPGHHTRHTPPPCYNISFLSLPVFSHFLTQTSCLFPAMVDWPVHAFAGLRSTVGSMLRTLFVLFATLHDLSAERWCS